MQTIMFGFLGNVRFYSLRSIEGALFPCFGSAYITISYDFFHTIYCVPVVVFCVTRTVAMILLLLAVLDKKTIKN